MDKHRQQIAEAERKLQRGQLEMSKSNTPIKHLNGFASRLRYSRVNLKLTQKELGKLSGVSALQISFFELGIRLPTLLNAINIAKALDVRLDWLAQEEPMIDDQCTRNHLPQQAVNQIIMNAKLEQIKAALRTSIQLAKDPNLKYAPWVVYKADSPYIITEDKRNCVVTTHGCFQTSEEKNATTAFIAHARTFAPAAAEALLMAIEEMEWQIEYSSDCGCTGGSFIAGCLHRHRRMRTALETICRGWPEIK